MQKKPEILMRSLPSPSSTFAIIIRAVGNGGSDYPIPSSVRPKFGIGYGIGQKYQPVQVSAWVSDLNKNNGFSRKLPQRLDSLLSQVGHN